MADSERQVPFLNPWVLHLQKLALELKCSFCLNLYTKPLLLPCNHIFCSSCVSKSDLFECECPLCKLPYIEQELRQAPYIENVVNIYRCLDASFSSHMLKSGDSGKKTVGLSLRANSDCGLSNTSSTSTHRTHMLNNSRAANKMKGCGFTDSELKIGFEQQDFQTSESNTRFLTPQARAIQQQEKKVVESSPNTPFYSEGKGGESDGRDAGSSDDVEAKRALSREEQNVFRQDQSNASNESGGAGNIRTKKIFVGGLPPTVTEEGFRLYFETFGHVEDAIIMFDQTTQRPRGFGFISFDSEDVVDRVLHKTFHDLNGKNVEVKRALPTVAKGYQNFGSSRCNSVSYDNRMDGNRFIHPQSGGGFPSYPGYNAGYGGPATSYGGYGMGGYGGGAGGFVGPTGGYGNSTAAAAGYGSGPSGMKTGWGNQTARYGSSGYGGGAAGYGQTGQIPGGGQGYVSQAYGGYGGGAAGYGQTTQTPGGGQGYGSQAYGGSGGGEYGSGGYGAVGCRSGSGPTSNSDAGEQATGGIGYMGSGNSGWRSESSSQ